MQFSWETHWLCHFLTLICLVWFVSFNSQFSFFCWVELCAYASRSMILLLIQRKLWHWSHRCMFPHSILACCLWLPLWVIHNPWPFSNHSTVPANTSFDSNFASLSVLYWIGATSSVRASCGHAAVKVHWIYCSGAVTLDKRICSPHGHPYRSWVERYWYS